MTTQGTSQSLVLPEDLQQAVNIANAKVSVLREENQRLERTKVEVEKDTARLELRRDELVNEINKFIAEKETAEGELGKVERRLEDAKVAFGLLDAELVVAKKELISAREATAVEGVKLSTIVAQAREAQVTFDARKAAVAAQEKEIEERKARIKAALETL